jgi:hypothetical protein
LRVSRQTVGLIGDNYRVATTEIPAEPGGELSASKLGEGQNRSVDLLRIGWLATVFVCLIVVLTLVLDGYLGYAGVAFAVAVAAAINLF